MPAVKHAVFKLSLAVLCGLSTAQAVEIQGTGSSAAAPLYVKWAGALQKNGHSLKYDAAGSERGLAAVKANQSHFGATDVLPPAAELNKAGLVAFPIAVTAVVPVINLPGVKGGQLKLNGDVLAQIFSGKITDWNDPAIAALNNGERLPSKSIKLVVRADGSGTTFALSEYLAATNKDWKAGMGTGFSLKWPAGVQAVKGGQALASAVKNTEGAIGYVDFGHVADQSLADVKLGNAEGKFIKVTPAAITDAVMNSNWASKGDFDDKLINKTGAGTWPIVTGTFAVLPKVVDKAAGNTVAELFVRGFMSGDAAVSSLSLVRLPDQIKGKATNAIATVRDKAGQPLSISYF
ncbi:phosphate ABC transporter substrate-binding protein PstS [Chitinivorax sp. B]|uniref:phosphate ABC transporter substrate-binding protein PstS n=1 Tax=Chitinivorax sp. B TaxID=2502235 RepID=UPI001485BBBF|nr:phosphate ABC transporter substrate-binding protein PstS [Chitinivorax sp. B]